MLLEKMKSVYLLNIQSNISHLSGMGVIHKYLYIGMQA